MTRILMNVCVLALALLATACSNLDAIEPAAAADATLPATKHRNAWTLSLEVKRAALKRATLNTGISVLRTQDNQLRVNVPSDFSFDTDSAVIKPDMVPVLDQFADELEVKPLAHMLIHIVGYADSRGGEAANDSLSLARAVSVGKYLESKGIAHHRIGVEGRGEHKPMVSNDKGYGRALNRRVEMYLRDPVGES